MTVALDVLAAHADALLRASEIPDYPNAVNGVQFAHRGPVHKIATAVDASQRTIEGAIAAGANLLIVHHGLFWSGLQPITGYHHHRIRMLLGADIAVYAAHLPLDAHETLGNSRLLARVLGLDVATGFAHFKGTACGVQGTADIATSELVSVTDAFARAHGGRALASATSPDQRTRRWAICSGAPIDHALLAEVRAGGIDTLIVGEGPHWSAVEAPERGVTIVYAGHYATETLGVAALGQHLSATFGVPHEFIAAPTGL